MWDFFCNFALDFGLGKGKGCSPRIFLKVKLLKGYTND